METSDRQALLARIEALETSNRRLTVGATAMAFLVAMMVLGGASGKRWVTAETVVANRVVITGTGRTGAQDVPIMVLGALPPVDDRDGETDIGLFFVRPPRDVSVGRAGDVAFAASNDQVAVDLARRAGLYLASPALLEGFPAADVDIGLPMQVSGYAGDNAVWLSKMGWGEAPPTSPP